MLAAGYINFFEDECCFVGDPPERMFCAMHAGDRVLPDGAEEWQTLRVRDGVWRLEGASRLQGLRVRIELARAASGGDGEEKATGR